MNDRDPSGSAGTTPSGSPSPKTPSADNPSANKPSTDKPSADKPNLRRRALGWLLRIVVFAGLFVGISTWQESDLLPLAKDAPDFRLRTLDGRTVRLSDYRGKSVVLHFWATWCGVCRQEFSMLNRVASSLGEDAVLLSVVADADNPDLQAFVRSEGLSYPVLGADRDVLKRYQIKAFPTNYFIDGEGKVRSRSVGLSTSLAMRTRLSCAR